MDVIMFVLLVVELLSILYFFVAGSIQILFQPEHRWFFITIVVSGFVCIIAKIAMAIISAYVWTFL